MGYYEFILRSAGRSKDALLNKMTEMGCLGVTENDNDIRAFFRDGQDVSLLRDGLNSFRKVLADCGLDDNFSLDYSYLSERDWNESWKKKFVPIDVGRNLSILPPWEKGDEKRVKLIIDPGMAFGTGHHETTKTCLMLIERFSSPSPAPSPKGRGLFGSQDKTFDSPLPLGERDRVRGFRKDRFLDIGTGTGILAIAASRLGFREVLGVDIDPLAVDAAGRNAELNGLANIAIREGDVSVVRDVFDMIAANLMSDVLIMIAPEIASRLDDGGIVILSGMLVGQDEGVTEALENSGLKVTERLVDGRWVSLVARHNMSLQ